jgi:2-methylcitrate dehydratase PrpD
MLRLTEEIDHMSTVAGRLGRFAADVRYEDLPSDVLDKVRACLAHGLLVGSAGRVSPLGAYAESAVAVSSGPARVLTTGRRLATAHAALVNATVLHSRVQEDTYGTSHLGTVVIPTALALGEQTRADGRELLTAIAAGYEVAAALAGPGTARSSARGFRASSVYGPFAAAAVAGRLLGLSGDGIAAALSYASAFGGGTLESFAQGTPEWQFQNGVAAHNGIVAAGIAAAGAPSAPTGIEGPAGYLAAFWGTTDGADAIGRELGTTWALREVTFKLYPVCAFNQAPVALAVALADEAGITAADVERAEVAMNPYEAGYPGMAHAGPFRTVGETQMSTRFGVASGLLRGGVAYADLLAYDDPRLQALVPRIDVVAEADRKPMTARLTVWLADGTQHQAEIADGPQGYLSWGFDRSRATAEALGPERGLTDADVDDLLDAIADLEPRTADALIDPLVRGLPVAPATTAPAEVRA